MSKSPDHLKRIEAVSASLRNQIDRLSSYETSVKNSDTLPMSKKALFENDGLPLINQLIHNLESFTSLDLENIPDRDLQNILICLGSDHLRSINEIILDFIQSENQVTGFTSNVLMEKIKTFFYTNPAYGDHIKDDYVPFIDLATKLLLSNWALPVQAEKNLKQSIEKLAEAQKELDTSKASAKELLDKADAIQKGAAVKDYIKKFENEADQNLNYLRACIGAIFILVVLEWIFVILPLCRLSPMVRGYSDNLYYLLIMKSAFFGLFSMSIFYALLKGCSAFLHNYLVNREKASSLYAFDKFFTVHEDETLRLTAIMEVVRTVLGIRDTGIYKQQENGGDSYLDKVKSIIDIKDAFKK